MHLGIATPLMSVEKLNEILTNRRWKHRWIIQILGVMKQKIWMSLPKVHQKFVKNVVLFCLVKAIQTNNAEEMFHDSNLRTPR